MTPLRVSGLACPWNVYNSYDELLKPGAFAAFIEKHPQGVPMFFMHEIPCGHWDSLKETREGLWVDGRITDPTYVSLVEHTREFRQMSITYGLPTTNRVETLERLNSRPPWMRAKHSERFKILPRIEVPEAFLAEISIVDEGAFPGTYLTVD